MVRRPADGAVRANEFYADSQERGRLGPCAIAVAAGSIPLSTSAWDALAALPDRDSGTFGPEGGPAPGLDGCVEIAGRVDSVRAYLDPANIFVLPPLEETLTLLVRDRAPRDFYRDVRV